MLQQEKMTGQRGKLRALAGICHVYESYFKPSGCLFFLAEVCFPRRPHIVLPRSQVVIDTSSARVRHCFSFKHQTEVGLHTDVSEDRRPLEQRLSLV